MAKITVNLNITLDGVMQGPGHPDEDRRGGFEYGGWAAPYVDPAIVGEIVANAQAKPGALLFGRHTYQHFYSVWPQQTGNPFSGILNKAHKYVASTTLSEPLPWMNSTLLKGEAGETVAKLKQQSELDMVILGSGLLVKSLMRHNLIDRYELSIHPLVLGCGFRLFDEGGPYAKLKLVESRVSSTGVILATYAPEDRSD